VYSECLSALSTVGPDLLHSEHSSQANRLVIADLDIDHYFLPVQHVWSREELRPTLETLALLHLSAESLPLEKYPLLMPAPDRRWESDIIQRAVRSLVDDRTYASQGRRLLPVVELLLKRMADQFDVWQQVSRTLLHSDFNCSNVALERTGEAPARLIDWHIAASGMAAFEIASIFFQPHHNHRNLERRAVLGDYLEARHRLSGNLLHPDDEWDSFCYATAANGLSYLPPVARQLQATGSLQGWWSNMLAAIVDNLTWCASL
jgi:thiamine kinase-like enzyme